MSETEKKKLFIAGYEALNEWVIQSDCPHSVDDLYYQYMEKTDTMGMDKAKLIREKQFGLDGAINQILWNGQVEDFEVTKNEIVAVMRAVMKDKELQSQLNGIEREEEE